jgi:thiaminase (transcriptional activator TenA)
MSGFSERVWQRTSEMRAAIDNLPFNRELAAGTLDHARFIFYIQQDALYLDQYSRILAMAGARGPDNDTLRLFGSCALEAIAVEQALHSGYLTNAGGMESVEPTPDCLGYTSFLLATAYHDPWEVLMAALLPCFWLYWDVGNTIARLASPNNPYQAWIDTYSDDAFGDAVKQVIAATDTAAVAASEPVRAKMVTAFIRSCQYEYLFWDSAYHQRKWPVNAA